MWRASFSLLLLLAQPLRAEDFDQIVSSIHAGNHDEVCAGMERWVAAHRGDPRVPQAELWMAQIRFNDRRGELAAPLYERVLRDAPDSKWALHAKKGLADVDLLRHRYDRAIARYDALSALPDPHWQYVGSNAALHAKGERLRFRVLVVLAALLLLVAATQLYRAPSLWPPPRELVWGLPLLLCIFAASFGQEPEEAAALRTLSVGAIALLWAQGAALRDSRRFWLPALSGFAQCLALLYCALIANGLWEKLVDTVAMGAE